MLFDICESMSKKGGKTSATMQFATKIKKIKSLDGMRELREHKGHCGLDLSLIIFTMCMMIIIMREMCNLMQY